MVWRLALTCLSSAGSQLNSLLGYFGEATVTGTLGQDVNRMLQQFLQGATKVFDVGIATSWLERDKKIDI